MTNNVDGVAGVSGPVAEWERGAWCLAALVLAARNHGETLGDAATGVLEAVGITRELLATMPFTQAQLEGFGAAPLLKTAALISGQVHQWSDQDDETLRAQGQGSGAAATMFERMVLPHYPELATRMAANGARMLDVGTGIGALGAGFARAFPNLHVTGLDVMPRALELAAATIAEAGLQNQMVVRNQDVSTLDESETFDLAWIPAPFVPEPAFSLGVARVAAALRPGGMLMIGHGRFGQNPLDDALTRFQTIAYGGTAIDDAEAEALLTSCGLRGACTLPTPPGAPGITVALK